MKVVSNTQQEELRVLRRALHAAQRQAAGGAPTDEHGRGVRLLIIFMGAGFGGVFGSGAAQALQEAGIGRLAHGFAGISSGVMTSVMLAMERAQELVPFYTNLLTPDMSERERARKRRSKLDLRAEVIDRVNELIGHDAIHRTHAQLYAVVTEWPTGKGKLIDLKNPHNLYSWLDAAEASMAIPGYFKRKRLGDKEYVDGAASLPIPLIQAIRATDPTDILIIASRPKPDEISWMERAFFQWYTSLYLRWADPMAPAIRRGMEQIDDRTESALRHMRIFSKIDINCLAIFPSAVETLFPLPLPGFNVLNPLLVDQVGSGAKSLMEGLLKKSVTDYGAIRNG